MSGTLEFLRRVLPAEGKYVGASMVPGAGKMKNKVFGDSEALAQALLTASANGHDTWFALAAYQRGWHREDGGDGKPNRLRTQANVRALRALWVDIDVDPGKAYASLDEAKQGLRRFLLRFLPPHFIVGSGSGLH